MSHDTVADALNMIENAKKFGFDYDNISSLTQLALAYTQNKNLTELFPIYNRLLELDPQNIDFRARFAFLYRESGDYVNARKQASKLLGINPEIDKEIEDFLRTLPY